MKHFIWVVSLCGLVGCGVTKTMDDMNSKMDQMNQKMDKVSGATEKMDGTTGQMKDIMSDKMDTTNSITSGMRDSMDDLQKTTQGMSVSTDELVRLTKFLGANTSVLAQLTENLSLDARPAFALALRRQSLDRMNQSRVMEVKLSEATTFFMAQEFQVWKGVGSDDLNRREMLKGQAASEFFRIVKEWTTKDRSLSPGSSENRVMNLYALTTALHTISEDQARVTQALRVPPVSMLSIIRQSLFALADIKKGKRSAQNLPAYMTEVINNDELAIYLLQLRYNFLVGMALANVTTLNLAGHAGCSEGYMSCLDAGLTNLRDMMNKARMYLFDWKPTLSQKNVVQVQVYNSFLAEALRTRELLTILGKPAPLNGLVRKILSNMQIVENSEETLKDLGSEITHYHSYITEILK
ncbi:MAG: hypothetical protein IT289_02220 [Oligoflexia bacterium]|nr:hypothetical protein [Oligoflexia bacterium]